MARSSAGGSSAAARPDPARHSAARPDTARPDAARPDTARPDAARPDAARPDPARPDAARPDAARPDPARHSAARPDPARPDVARHGAARASVASAPGRRVGRRTLVALGAAVLTLGAAAAVLPVLHTANGQDAAVADTALSSHSVILKADRKHESDSDKKSSKHATSASKIKTGSPKNINVDLTGYSWFDNTPHGSSEVANPIVHQEAGGSGTYADPITVAVAGHSFPAGTRFYVPELRRYLIVEDSGASDGNNHLDVWTGGKGGSESGVNKCMDRFTGKASAIQNPPAGKPVLSGPIYGSGGCRLPAGSTSK